ncbi:MAG: hypothetical protein HOV80_26570 [Polyangiaceae bacterium]|nr:hypothetical protein [Polyangiaceae bacterium]
MVSGVGLRLVFSSALLLVACDADPVGTDTTGGDPSGTGAGAGGPTSSVSSSTTDTTSASTGTGGAGGGAPDPCTLVTPVCASDPPTQSAQGLVPLDRCAFALERSDVFDGSGALIDELETIASPVTLADVLGDLNRTAEPIAASAVPGDPAGVELAFRWEDSENDKLTWIPQGITGSADASADALIEGRRIVLVSFYWNEDAEPATAKKGVRLAMVDLTNPQQPSYRFLLLVEPKENKNWGIVDIHAGGLAWFGDYLYVASTSLGLRVFDMRRILQADTSEDVIGCDGTTCKAGLYKYVLPQVGTYTRATPCDPAPIFSFVGLDRSSTPPALVTGEYCSDTACPSPLSGRVFRYPLDPASGLLAADVTYAADAFFMGERQVQGAAAIGDTFYLSSSEPAGGAGALYRVDASGRSAFGWIDTPEDLMVDGPAGQLFGLSEAVGERAVFAADLATYE